MVMYMYIDPGQRQNKGVIFFINSIIQTIQSFAARVPPLNYLVTSFNVQVTQFDLAVKQVKVNPGSSFI